MTEGVVTGCDVLFKRFFWPWYTENGVRPPTRVRGDMEVLRDAVGRPGAELSRLDESARHATAAQVKRMVEAARKDWPLYLGAVEVPSLDSLHAFDEHWNRQRIAEAIRASDSREFSNEYLVLCCELGAVLGEVLCNLEPCLEWVEDWPYWESALWHRPTGSLIPVFHWSVMKMSSYGVDDGLRAKVLASWEFLKRGH